MLVIYFQDININIMKIKELHKQKTDITSIKTNLNITKKSYVASPSSAPNSLGIKPEI